MAAGGPEQEEYQGLILAIRATLKVAETLRINLNRHVEDPEQTVSEDEELLVTYAREVVGQLVLEVARLSDPGKDVQEAVERIARKHYGKTSRRLYAVQGVAVLAAILLRRDQCPKGWSPGRDEPFHVAALRKFQALRFVLSKRLKVAVTLDKLVDVLELVSMF